MRILIQYNNVRSHLVREKRQNNKERPCIFFMHRNVYFCASIAEDIFLLQNSGSRDIQLQHPQKRKIFNGID